MPVNLANRLTALTLPNSRLLNLPDSITGGGLDLAMLEASQLTVTFSDPYGQIASAKGVAVGEPLYWGSIQFSIADLEHGPVEGARSTTIVARSAGWQRLKHDKAHRGPRTWRGVSPSHVVMGEAKSVGLKTVIQATAKRTVVTRLPKGQKKGPRVSTLEMVERLAGESGFVFGEVGGVFHFAAPSWLVRRKGYTVDATSDFMLEYPTMSKTRDDVEAPSRVTLVVAGDKPQSVLLPFTPVQLSGVPRRFAGRYLVNTVSIPLSSADPAQIELVAPVDPEKQDRD